MNPIHNFYLYANGEWIKNAKIPDDQTEWGTFQIAHEQNIKKLESIVKNLSNDPSKKNHVIGLLYDKLVRTKTKSQEKSIMLRLKTYTSIINNLNNDSLASNTFASIGNVLGSLAKIGTEPFFSIGAMDDIMDSKIVRLTMSMPTLSLPEREYYFDKSLASYVDDFSSNIKTFLKYCSLNELLFFESDEDIEYAVNVIIDIERFMASIMKPIAERRKIEEFYFKTTITDFIKIVTNISDDLSQKSISDISELWRNFFKRARVNHAEYIVIYDMTYMKNITKFLVRTSLKDLIIYMNYITIRNLSPILINDLDEICFDFFGRKLQGQQAMKSISRRVIDILSDLVGEILSREYIDFDEKFNYKLRHEVEIIVKNIKLQLEIALKKSEWMSDETKKHAQLKLKSLRTHIGYPDVWKDHTKINNVIKNMIQENNNDCGCLLDIMIIINMYKFKTDVFDLIDQPPDLNHWSMNTYEVNAYYDPQRNEMVFPVGIFQKPFFDLENSIFENYGAIGSIIGHEITHGYDDQGRKYDNEGNIKNWWTFNDLENFKVISKNMSDQYSSYVVNESATDKATGKTTGKTTSKGRHINGELTLGENLADLGGIVLAFRAANDVCSKNTNQYRCTNDERKKFFVSYAKLWRKIISPKKILSNVLSDPHSPSMFRVFVLRNIDEFYQVFSDDHKEYENQKCNKKYGKYDGYDGYDDYGESMYLEKSKRIYLW
jgi:putative endopeptidase